MNGLVNRAIERFVRDTYGRDMWMRIMRALEFGFTEFEPMLSYEDDSTSRLLVGVSEALNKAQQEVLEDIGTYLVSHENMSFLRRLLRFGGETFYEFLLSLDDLPGRARLALSDIQLPEMRLREMDEQTYSLSVQSDAVDLDGFGHVLVGILRAMADDYGALALLDHTGTADGAETISITLLETAFASGRAFDLGCIEA